MVLRKQRRHGTSGIVAPSGDMTSNDIVNTSMRRTDTIITSLRRHVYAGCGASYHFCHVYA